MKICPSCKLHHPDDATHCFVDGTGLEVMQDTRIGTVIDGRYLIEEVIGEGGMATVYRARHTLVDRPCAVKVMSRALSADKVGRERFRREARSAQKLAHPNIIEIFDHGDTERGAAFLVMELLEGETLGQALMHGPLPIGRALSVMIQTARALSRAHDFEVIHRDLKPDNIFLCRQRPQKDWVKLLDFGIARSMQDSRLTGTGEVFGTPQYMAPERITSIEAGPPADIYALGIIAYEALTGQLPFIAKDIPGIFVKHMKAPPPKLREQLPDAPPALENLILAMLEKRAENRPVDAHQVYAALSDIARDLKLNIPADKLPASQESQRGPAATLPPAALDRWAQRGVLFSQMLEQAFGGRDAAPAPMRASLERVLQLIDEVGKLRGQAMSAQRQLNSLEARERDGRQRFGRAMDALGIDASGAKDELRRTQEMLNTKQEKVQRSAKGFEECHEEILRWEGRCAMQEPYLPLAEAYDKAALQIRKWKAARRELDAAEKGHKKQAQLVRDLEFQVKEIRTNMQRFEQNIDSEKSDLQRNISELGKASEERQEELVKLAVGFCEPLRKRPELEPLFAQLEGSTINSIPASSIPNFPELSGELP